MSRPRAAYSVGVVSEAVVDRRVATGLAERVLCEAIEWVEPETVGSLCRWRGFEESTDHLPWKSVLETARRYSIRDHGKFGGGSRVFDRHRARQAKRLFMTLDPRPAALLLVRDTDNQEGRAESLREIQDEEGASMVVLLALPHTKLECWLLAGYEPRDAEEEQKLATERQRLGFDPRERAERLKAQKLTAKTHAKKTLTALVGDDHARRESCWRDASLTTLRERGGATGLTDFLDEVRDRLVPIIGG